MQNGARLLTSKKSFLTEAHFRILRPPQDSWRQNESVGIFGFLFQASISPARKLRQQLKYQFWFRKTCFQNLMKHKQYIYQIEAYEVYIDNSRVSL